MRNARRLAPCLASLLVLGCPIDRRELRTTAAGAGSRDASSDATAGVAAETPASESEGGASSGSQDLVEGCADLDTDGVADCTTTLLDNGSFRDDVRGWQALAGTELSWQPKNALHDLPSGSAALDAAVPQASAVQCAALAGEQLVIAYSSAYVEGSAGLGRATLEVSFFEEAACAGAPVLSFETPPSPQSNGWATLHAGAPSTPGTASISIALHVYKSDGAERTRAYFDNVMLKAQPLM